MRQLKRLAVIGLAPMAIGAFLATDVASATTLAIGGSPKNNSLGITFADVKNGPIVWKRTSGPVQNECKDPHAYFETTGSFTGTTVGGPVSDLTYHECNKSVTVDQAGSLTIERVGSSTNGTVKSSGTEVTVFSEEFNLYITCKTGSGTDIGELVGSGDVTKHAVLIINTVLNCGFVVPSANVEGLYVVAEPTGLGVEG